MKKFFDFMVEDSAHTFNINMHTQFVLAEDDKAAMERLYQLRPEFLRRSILSVHVDNEPVNGCRIIGLYSFTPNNFTLWQRDKLIAQE